MDAETESRFNQIQGQILELNQQIGRVLGHMERDVERRQSEDRAFGKFRDDIQELFTLGPQVKQVGDLVAKNITTIEKISSYSNARFEDIDRWRNRLRGASAAYSSMFSILGGIVVLIGETAYHLFISGSGRAH